MTCPDPKMWELLSMDLLDEHEADSARRHAEQCDACRAAFIRSRRDHAYLLRAFEVFDRRHDQQREELIATLPLVVPERERRSGSAIGGWLGDAVMSMRQKKSRWAAAALLPAAVLVYAFLSIVGPKTSVAFTQVLERIREARTMVCDLAMDYTIESESLPDDIEWKDGKGPDTPKLITTRGTLSMYSDGVTRAWLTELQDPPRTELQRSDRMYVTENGKLSVVKLTDEPDAPGYIESPGELLQRMLQLTEEPDDVLGREVIDGRQAVGFEIAASRLGLGDAGDESGGSVVNLWVDVETQLPVRVEYDVVQRGGPVQITMNGVWDHIRWNVPLDPASFEPPEVTETTEVTDLAMPPASEDALIEGLRTYLQVSAQVTKAMEAMEAAAKKNPANLPLVQKMRQWLDADHAYPQHLDPQSLMMALATRQGAISSQTLIKYKRVHGADSKPTEEQQAQMTKEAERIAGAIGAAGLYYRKLIMDGRKPQYFGATVEPGDAMAELIRWTLDDGSVRVIYGDLHAETLPAGD